VSHQYYRVRRSAITDALALFGLLAGILGAARFGWPFMTANADAGHIERGVAGLAGLIVSGGIAGGGAGLIAGALLAWIWARVHRWSRPKL